MTPTGVHTSGSRLLFAGLLILGVAARVALAPLDGAPRVSVWKIWSVNAVTQGAAALYGDEALDGGRPLLNYEGRQSAISSPPGALYSLQLAGELYRRYDPTFTDGPLFTAAVKLPGIVAEFLLIGLIYIAVRRLMDPPAARWALLAYWLNPAVIWGGTALGLLTPIVALAAVGALVCTTWGYPTLAGSLIAAAILTDLQALLLLPVLMLALNRRVPLRTEAYMWATGGAVVTMMLVLTPLASRGTLPSAARLLATELGLESVREQATGLWEALPELSGMETTARAASAPVEREPAAMDWLTTVARAVMADHRLWIVPLLALIGLWALWRARAIRFLPGWAGLAALFAHAASLIEPSLSIPSLLLAIAFLAIASAESGRYRALLVALTVVLGANMVLASNGLPIADDLFGPGFRIGIVLRAITGLALVWHAAIFRSECSREAPRPRRLTRDVRYALAARAKP